MLAAMLLRRLLPVLLLAAALAPAPARAAPKQPVGALVATSGTVELRARDEGSELCLDLVTSPGSSNACESDDDGVVVVGEEDSRGAGPAVDFVGAAVPAAAASVEVRRAGKLLVSAPVTAGPAYTGRRAGRTRFALLAVPPGTQREGLRVRALDPGGAPVEVLAPDPAELDGGPRVLLSGRSGGVRWSVGSFERSSPSPAVFDLDHETIQRCLRIRAAGRTDSADSEGTCAGGAPQDAVLEGLFASTSAGAAATQELCHDHFRLLHGAVPGPGARVTAVLGDGRVARARTAPFAEAGTTAYAVVVPAAAAIREVRVQAPGGSVRSLRFSAPPLGVACASGVLGSGLSLGSLLGTNLAEVLSHQPAITPAGPVTTVPGTPGFSVADGAGDSLCVAVSPRPLTSLGCGIVAPGLSDGAGALDSYEHPRAFVLAVPARVARIRFGPKAGPMRELATVEAPGYAGRYAGRVRFAAATLRGFEDLQRTQYLDASGRVLHTERDDTSPADLAAPVRRPVRRLAGAPGHPGLWRTQLGEGADATSCLALTSAGPPKAAQACQTIAIAPATVLVAAPCATHRLSVAVTVPAGARVRIQRGDGARQELRVRRGAALLTLPRGGGLRSVTVVPRRGRALRFPLRAPPASEQCGWTAAATTDGGSSSG